MNEAPNDERFHVAVVGAGPAGLSAAARAAGRDREAGASAPTHVLIEGSAKHANTIQRYQKGKLVMAEPAYLDLRSDLPFERASREAVLAAWEDGLESLGINVRYEATLTGIEGAVGDFRLAFADGSRIAAEHVVLAIGTQGNPRLLAAPGADDPRVQYQLDDPDAYGAEHILVIGAGDAAIENALALAADNRVTILNRGTEFSRAKESNLQAILRAINDPDIALDCFYGTTVARVEASEESLGIHLATPDGEVRLDCERILARLGSTPPRAFLDALGIGFSGPGADAVPALDQHYRSSVPGIHVVGALAGNPLIKQAMNQGHDVIEFINGHDIEPADQPILEARFAALPFRLDVSRQVERLERLIPMFAELNTLQFRELLIDSDMLASYPPGEELERARRWLETTTAPATDERYRPRLTRLLREGETIHRAGEYGTSFYTILAGEVLTRRTLGDGRTIEATLERGEFFGETGLLSGHPRQEQAVAGPGCILMETPRRTMLKLVASNEEVRSGIDWMYTVRELQRHLAPTAGKRELRGIAAGLEIVRRRVGETLYAEGDVEHCLYLVRSGGFTLSRGVDSGAPQFIDQVRAGRMLGQLALMGDPVRRESAVATVESSAVRVDRAAFETLMARPDAPVASLQEDVAGVLGEHTRMEVRPEAGSALHFLMEQGLGEATDVLIIDESLCIGCDNCEKACAETHGGVSSLARTVGPTFAGIHVPSACRHCVQPHCMKDCPPDALHRADTGEVFIDDTCIGCGNCQTNCPYGVIRMVEKPAKRPGLFGWALFGRGDGPGESRARGDSRGAARGDAQTPKKAVKCDACMGVPSGPACVSACPTGAAMRLVPGDYVRLVEEKQAR